MKFTGTDVCMMMVLLKTARQGKKHRRKQWTVATLNRMLQLFRDGVSVEKLAEKYNRTPTAIRQQACKHGVHRTKEHISAVMRKASGLPAVREPDE